jgi:hypothetical protein
MVSIVPHRNRIAAATLAVLAIAMCAASGSSATGFTRPISPVSVDCDLRSAGTGGLADIDGFTVTPICPSEGFPSVSAQAFDSLAAGLVSQNGVELLRVLVGQRKSGDGDAYVRDYVSTLADRTPQGVGVSSEPQQVSEHVVTHFNVPLRAEGYAYADGPSVVIAYVAAGAPPATVEDAVTKILDQC